MLSAAPVMLAACSLARKTASAPTSPVTVHCDYFTRETAAGGGWTVVARAGAQRAAGQGGQPVSISRFDGWLASMTSRITSSRERPVAAACTANDRHPRSYNNSHRHNNRHRHHSRHRHNNSLRIDLALDEGRADEAGADGVARDVLLRSLERNHLKDCNSR